ncbi:Ribulose bisphosphate carboxylase small subunit 1A, chloroplastic [Cymbomonas tetramitiformis]|uniref:Ribulose bisphosphate carboxylase small subunit, chloroplastic n=1 Tax=Cymbomonas tetramitiformis TaxID=36881 RepID=A0AAE0GDI3_9CHLO|nr:Ribulose bisphosphate carboxylase small subunit 1A, chloroplastic [Cymbomonas tetramitiformis]
MSAIASINVAPVRAFNGLKGEQSAKAAFKVTNGFKTSAMMVTYITSNGWTPCLEFSESDMAYTINHGPDGIVSSASCGYYSNRYWTMWKLPMFGCTDSSQVLAEVAKCSQAFPNAYVRIAGFDNVKQVQCASFLVYRPIGGAAKAVNARSV